MLETVVVVSPLTSCRTQENPYLVCLGQVDFTVVQVTFSAYLLDGQEPRQAIHPVNF